MVQKEDFINNLAAKGYTKASANTILDDFLNTVTELLMAGESIQFRGFGTFEIREHASRESTDVKTHERFTIPAYKNIHFTPGNKLKRAIKEGIVRE